MAKREYWDEDLETAYTAEDVQGFDAVDKKRIMEVWFRSNYEDPAERTPYESREGGYQWIWGGPYDASEEIGSEFLDIVDQDLIDEVVSELEAECVEWAPTESPGDYDDYIVDSIASITEFYHNFSGSILDIEKLLEVEVPGSVEINFYRMLFVNVITSIETYLSDAFISTVVSDKEIFRRFIETTPEFKKEKITIAEVFSASEVIEEKGKAYLAEVVWHNLERVSLMYRDTMNVEWPNDTGDIYRAILKRHHIVHRNGKDQDGNEIIILKYDVNKLVTKAEEFVQYIDSQLNNDL